MIAVTQAARGIGDGDADVQRPLGAGKTRTEALRLLRPRLSDVVFRAMLAAERRQATSAAADQATAA